ncbi:MAG TPA: hypothetical protein VK812_05195 [Candidatus Binatus sp.]|nr:hypothetical protein [Candidatus Binatus sp.]
MQLEKGSYQGTPFQACHEGRPGASASAAAGCRGQAQRIKPSDSRFVDGIAEEVAEKLENVCSTVEERRFSAA